jgi:hypothetical protein
MFDSNNADWVAAAGTWAGVLLTGLTLYVVWNQLADLRASVQRSTALNIYSHMVDIDRFFIEHPHLKPYFYGGPIPAIDEVPSHQQLLSVAEMMVDYFDSVYQQKECSPKDTFGPKMKYMRQIYEESSVLREFLDANAGWYDPAFVDEIKSHKNAPDQ